jgi:hypothetical protein
MSTYRITNITNSIGKRDFKFNSVLDVDYVDGMMKKTVKVKPGDAVYLTIPSLPLSVHRLRVKGLITVIEVTPGELSKAMGSVKPVVVVTKKAEEKTGEKVETKKSAKKKFIKEE